MCFATSGHTEQHGEEDIFTFLGAPWKHSTKIREEGETDVHMGLTGAMQQVGAQTLQQDCSKCTH